MNAQSDRDRANELVQVGTRWHGWGHHHTIVDDRVSAGVREVRMVRDERGPKGMERGKVSRKAKPGEWVPAWRVQKFCDRSRNES